MLVEKNCESASLSSSQPVAKTDLQPAELSTVLYARAKAVVARNVAGETLVLPVRGDVGDLACFYGFNGTGTTIWEALEKPRNLKDLCDAIDRKHDVNRRQAEEDVALFLREICSLGLARVVADPGDASSTMDEKSDINNRA